MANFFRHLSLPAHILAVTQLCWAGPAKADEVGNWIDSRQFLNTTPPPVADQSFLFSKPIVSTLKQSLLNPEQHRQMLDLQVRTGTKTQDARLHSLSVGKLSSNETSTKPAAIALSISSFAGREVKSAILPEPLRKGASFELGSGAATTQATDPQPVRYGLIVTNVEPSSEAFRLAAIPGDELEEYALVNYAPKAKVTYSVGPLPQEAGIADSAPLTPEKNSSGLGRAMPDLHFRGKVLPRGAPTGKDILPPQSLILEQSQGFYSLELQTSKVVHKDAVFHRFRLPLAGTMSLREERNEKMQRSRSTLENVYASGPLALNIDYFTLEKRYQTGLIYQQSQTRIEFYSHLPENFTSQGWTWKTHRYELKVQTAF